MVDYAEFACKFILYWFENSTKWVDKTVEIKKFEMIIFKLLLNTHVVKTNQGVEDKLKSCFYLNSKETFV